MGPRHSAFINCARTRELSGAGTDGSAKDWVTSRRAIEKGKNRIDPAWPHREDGTLRLKDARLKNGRRIAPAEVDVFTMCGMRSLDIQLNGEELKGFIVPLPARPGKKFLEWNEWGPRPPQQEFEFYGRNDGRYSGEFTDSKRRGDAMP